MFVAMKIKSISGTGNFKIENNEKEVLELTYKSRFSSTARTKFNNVSIEIKPKNIWNTSFDIFHNGMDVGDISFNWMSNAAITINEDKYLLRTIGFWGINFELINEDEDKIFFIKPNLNWKKGKYDYTIEVIVENYELIKIIELLIYVGFGVNLHMTATMKQ